MNRTKIIIAGGLIIIAIIIYFIITGIRNNKIQNNLNKIQKEQSLIVSKKDSLIIINSVIDSLNKKNEKELIQIKHNIKIINNIDTMSLNELQHILQRNLYK